MTKTQKIVLFTVFFIFVTIVAVAMKKPDKTVPPISDAILIVGLFFAIGYGLLRLIKKFFFKKELNKTIEYREDTITKNKSSKKKFIWIGIGVIAFIFILSISQSGKNLTPVKTDKSSEYSEVSGNLYRNTKYNFRIKFPEGWDIKPGDGPNILQKAVRGNHTISITIKELPTGFNNEKLTIKDVFTLKEFENKLFDESLLQKYPETKLIDSGETKINNLPAFWYKMSFSSSVLDVTVDMVGLRYAVLYKNVFYFISAGTVAEEFVSVEPEFEKSIATFVLEDY